MGRNGAKSPPLSRSRIVGHVKVSRSGEVDPVNRGVSWLDGELTSVPKISTENRGFLVGMGVFETLKVVEGHVEFLEKHLDRIKGAWDRIGTGPLDIDRIRSGVGELLFAHTHYDQLSRLRITATECNGGPSLLITLIPMQPWPETTTCVVLPWKRNENSPLVGVKTTSYADNVLGLKWAQERGFSEGVYVNNAGHLSEGATSNIFLAQGGEVLTPAIDCGLLPGIVREVILENGWSREATLSLTDLENADEVFVTSSTRGVHPVQQCGDRKFPRIGNITRQVMNDFQALRK